LIDLFANSDDTLLEGDIGDDVDYDLGNEDEDALLADDYDVQVSISTYDLLENLEEGLLTCMYENMHRLA
jgi:hypothetical protein